MPVTYDTPRLAVYRSGHVNLNGEATRLMHTLHDAVDLLPPARARQPWQLDRRPGSPSRFYGGHGRGLLRFRAPARAEQLFAGLRPEVQVLFFELLPPRDGLELYELATAHQNPAR